MVEKNLLKGNADKCNLLVCTSYEVSLNVNNFKITSIGYDNLRFDQHITALCRRASRKIHALARVTPLLNLLKRGLLMNYFFKSQFNYCP